MQIPRISKVVIIGAFLYYYIIVLNYVYIIVLKLEDIVKKHHLKTPYYHIPSLNYPAKTFYHPGTAIKIFLHKDFSIEKKTFSDVSKVVIERIPRV